MTEQPPGQRLSVLHALGRTARGRRRIFPGEILPSLWSGRCACWPAREHLRAAYTDEIIGIVCVDERTAAHWATRSTGTAQCGSCDRIDARSGQRSNPVSMEPGSAYRSRNPTLCRYGDVVAAGRHRVPVCDRTD